MGETEDFRQRVAAVDLEDIDLSYTASNVLYARGSLPKAVRRDAAIAIRTLRAILRDARDAAPTPKATGSETR